MFNDERNAVAVCHTFTHRGYECNLRKSTKRLTRQCPRNFSTLLDTRTMLPRQVTLSRNESMRLSMRPSAFLEPRTLRDGFALLPNTVDEYMKKNASLECKIEFPVESATPRNSSFNNQQRFRDVIQTKISHETKSK